MNVCAGYKSMSIFVEIFPCIFWMWKNVTDFEVEIIVIKRPKILVKYGWNAWYIFYASVHLRNNSDRRQNQENPIALCHFDEEFSAFWWLWFLLRSLLHAFTFKKCAEISIQMCSQTYIPRAPHWHSSIDDKTESSRPAHIFNIFLHVSYYVLLYYIFSYTI